MAHGFAKSGVTGKLAEFGVDVAPFLPALLYVATVLEVLGGLALAVGFHKFGAFLLLAFLVPVTAVMHWPIGADGAMDQVRSGPNGTGMPPWASNRRTICRPRLSPPPPLCSTRW